MRGIVVVPDGPTERIGEHGRWFSWPRERSGSDRFAPDSPAGKRSGRACIRELGVSGGRSRRPDPAGRSPPLRGLGSMTGAVRGEPGRGRHNRDQRTSPDWRRAQRSETTVLSSRGDRRGRCGQCGRLPSRRLVAGPGRGGGSPDRSAGRAAGIGGARAGRQRRSGRPAHRGAVACRPGRRDGGRRRRRGGSRRAGRRLGHRRPRRRVRRRCRPAGRDRRSWPAATASTDRRHRRAELVERLDRPLTAKPHRAG